ncbi:MAG TPA: phage major capsid protein [Dissulfurispiraceae bacterium]|nr:phage major capsid protein [Dissulfurispiraceae bacterium]
MWEIIETKQARYKLFEEQKALHLRAAEESRAFTAEEQAEWERRDADIVRMTAEIERFDKLAQIEETRAAIETSAGLEHARDDEEYTGAFRSWLKHGAERLTPEQRSLMQSHEARQMGIAVGSAGGFLVPQGFYQRIIEFMRAFGGIRASRAYILRTDSGQPLPIPTSDDTANTGMRIAENTQVTDLAPTIGQRILGAHMYTSRIVRVAIQLIEDSAFDIDDYLANVMGTRLGRITNTEFTTGTGTGQPQGVVTAATSGVVATAGSATSITYANLVAMEHSLDPAYRAGAEWMFHDSTLRALKQMVDGQSRPLWTPGLAMREADTILGYRYVVNQDMAAMAANARSILFGDFSRFFVRDVQNMQVMRLVERYADFLQVGFLAYSRHDSLLADTTAVRFYQNSAT